MKKVTRFGVTVGLALVVGTTALALSSFTLAQYPVGTNPRALAVGDVR